MYLIKKIIKQFIEILDEEKKNIVKRETFELINLINDDPLLKEEDVDSLANSNFEK
jgi:hypothetical protein